MKASKVGYAYISEAKIDYHMDNQSGHKGKVKGWVGGQSVPTKSGLGTCRSEDPSPTNYATLLRPLPMTHNKQD